MRHAFASLIHSVVLGLTALVMAGCAAPAHDGTGSGPLAAASGEGFAGQLAQLGVPYAPPAEGKAILVNIPAFELVAFEDGEPVLTSRVIVGTPWHRTPILETWVTRVTFRPTWRPTPSMVANGEYPDRVWPPGTRNPLGLAAVRLGPGLLVYLHDTNRRELFAREARALSHGCVRVEKWDELVAFVLDMPLEEVRRIANGRRTVEAPAPPIPVTLDYLLAFPDGAGGARRFADVYGLGGSLAPSRDVPPEPADGCIGPDPAP
jgi:murein L,D-transpeptidase YcbB/YkuD